MKKTTTTTRIRLEDGSVVEIRSSGEEDGSPSSSPSQSQSEEGEGEGEAIEVRLTPEEVTREQKQSEEKAARPDGDDDDDDGGGDLHVVPSWDGVQEGGKPLSRVERRKRIKAEIQRLSKGEAPVYYQRRLY